MPQSSGSHQRRLRLRRAAGLDLIFPGFFLMLLVDSLTESARLIPVALAAVAIAALACRFLPPGVSLLLAAVAALSALYRPADLRPSADRSPEPDRPLDRDPAPESDSPPTGGRP